MKLIGEEINEEDLLHDVVLDWIEEKLSKKTKPKKKLKIDII